MVFCEEKMPSQRPRRMAASPTKLREVSMTPVTRCGHCRLYGQQDIHFRRDPRFCEECVTWATIQRDMLRDAWAAAALIRRASQAYLLSWASFEASEPDWIASRFRNQEWRANPYVRYLLQEEFPAFLNQWGVPEPTEEQRRFATDMLRQAEDAD